MLSWIKILYFKVASERLQLRNSSSICAAMKCQEHGLWIGGEVLYQLLGEKCSKCQEISYEKRYRIFSRGPAVCQDYNSDPPMSTQCNLKRNKASQQEAFHQSIRNKHHIKWLESKHLIAGAFRKEKNQQSVTFMPAAFLSLLVCRSGWRINTFLLNKCPLQPPTEKIDLWVVTCFHQSVLEP